MFRFRFKKNINDWFTIPACEKTLEDAREYVKCLARCKYYSIDDIEIVTEKQFKKLSTPNLSKKCSTIHKKILANDIGTTPLTEFMVNRYGLDENEDLPYYILSADVSCGFYTKEQVLDILKKKEFYCLPDIYNVSNYKKIKKLVLNVVVVEGL
jgi:hypothetical protein